jgi:hypothetical protein
VHVLIFLLMIVNMHGMNNIKYSPVIEITYFSHESPDVTQCHRKLEYLLLHILCYSLSEVSPTLIVR